MQGHHFLTGMRIHSTHHTWHKIYYYLWENFPFKSCKLGQIINKDCTHEQSSFLYSVLLPCSTQFWVILHLLESNNWVRAARETCQDPHLISLYNSSVIKTVSSCGWSFQQRLFWVFQSCQANGRVILKSCVQTNPSYS